MTADNRSTQNGTTDSTTNAAPDTATDATPDTATDATTDTAPDTAPDTSPGTAKTTESTTSDSAASNRATPSNNALTLYGKMLTFSRMLLQTNDIAEIEASLASLLTNKSSQIPIVLDSEIEQDLPVLVDLLWSWGLQPIGVVDGILKEQATKLRLAIFPSEGKRIQSIRPPITVPVPVSATESKPTSASDDNAKTSAQYVKEDPSIELVPTSNTTNMVYNQMLRSGQSINHVGGDLILTNSINNGAEVITDNSLHIYGSARGRLVAGATGDKNAHIFCQSFNPSLVSVAGTYCLKDGIPADMIDQPVQVSYVEGEGLKFEIMNNT